MRSFPLFLTLVLFSTIAYSQQDQKYFEGTIVYRVSVQPKFDNLSVQDAHKMVMKGDSYTSTTKDGNYRETTGLAESYIIRKDKRAYFKFRKLDTLYYMDFSSDTSKVISHTRTDSNFRINGYPCKVYTLLTTNVATRYYYTPSLRVNPALSQDNTIGKWNLYNLETDGGIYLWSHLDYNFAAETDSCIRVEEKKVDDHFFDLPALPQKKFEPSEMFSRAHFPGKDAAWLKYLQNNLDTKVAAKYVKIARNQSEASQQVIVEFIVSEDGNLSNLQVVNKAEVDRHLAEEAMRVIQNSPRWAPAQFYGEKITTSIRQPVVFTVQRE